MRRFDTVQSSRKEVKYVRGPYFVLYRSYMSQLATLLLRGAYMYLTLLVDSS